MLFFFFLNVEVSLVVWNSSFLSISLLLYCLVNKISLTSISPILYCKLEIYSINYIYFLNGFNWRKLIFSKCNSFISQNWKPWFSPEFYSYRVLVFIFLCRVQRNLSHCDKTFISQSYWRRGEDRKRESLDAFLIVLKLSIVVKFPENTRLLTLPLVKWNDSIFLALLRSHPTWPHIFVWK